MELERGWEKFTGGPNRKAGDGLHVTINYRGMILMNARTHRQMGSPGAVTLYYNRDEDKIAVEPADPRLPEAYPVRAQGGNHRIQALSFCRHFGIRYTGTHRIVNPRITEERRMILDLRTTAPVSGGRKRQN